MQQSLFTFHIGSCYRAMRHCSVGHLCLFSKSVSSRVFGAVRHRVSRLSKRRFHTCYLYCMILCATLYRGICCEKHHCEAIAMLDSRQMTAPQRRITLTVLLDSFSSRRKWARNSGNWPRDQCLTIPTAVSRPRFSTNAWNQAWEWRWNCSSLLYCCTDECLRLCSVSSPIRSKLNYSQIMKTRVPWIDPKKDRL